jgi:hypothetical protein
VAEVDGRQWAASDGHPHRIPVRPCQSVVVARSTTTTELHGRTTPVQFHRRSTVVPNEPALQARGTDPQTDDDAINEAPRACYAPGPHGPSQPLQVLISRCHPRQDRGTRRAPRRPALPHRAGG